MDQGMTKDQLNEHIRSQVAPMIRDVVGTEVAELVREAVSQARPKSAVSQMFGDAPHAAQRQEAAGLKMARAVRALIAAKQRGGGADMAIKVLHGWGDVETAKDWENHIAKALSAGDPTAGGFLVPQTFSSDIIELLRPSAVVRSLDPGVMPMPTGSVKVPKITAGSTASYLGENTNIQASEPDTGQLLLTFKKLAALVPVSNDLVRYSSPQADSIVRDDMVRALATREDRAFIRDNGTNGTPRGIRSWINAQNKFAANATVNLANVTIDLGIAMQKLMDADIPLITPQFPAGAGGGTPSLQPVTARPGWIFSPRTYRYLTTVQNGQGFYAFRQEMLQGTLWGYPYRVTSQVPNTYTASGAAETGGNRSEVYFGAFAHAVIGESMGLMVDASQEAAYADAGGNVRAAFSMDQTVVRVMAEHDFALRYDKSFALIQDVLWGV